ncbi:MAG: hypothetical protein ACOX5J_04365 [Candidatus Hydrogenedentales bacterium]
MSLAKKPHLVFTIVLVIAVGAGCCSFTPKTTAPHTKVKTHRVPRDRICVDPAWDL